MTGLCSGLLVLSFRHKLVWDVRTIAMNGIDVDLPKGKDVGREGPTERLQGVTHGEEGPCARWRESRKKVKITVLRLDVASSCDVLC